MRVKQLIAITAAMLGTGAVVAQEATPESWATDTRPTATASRSRAEVQADLEIWKLSGLADLELRDSPDVFSERYRQASERYAALRDSPQFAARVQSLTSTRG
jgi:hypothetical protein